MIPYPMSVKHSASILGQYAEGAAADYLIKKGFIILARNFRYKRFEIDLIAQKRGLIVFIEVKARKNHLFGYPESFVKRKQIRGIRLAAVEYLRRQHCTNHRIRFDIIAVLGNDIKGIEIIHLEDGFY